jgi:phage tail sheath protein FI
MSRRKSTKKKRAASYLTPGVYVEEVSSGSRPIEGVGTAVAAFVGFARRQPVRAAIVAAAILAAAGAVVRAMHH